MRTFRELNEEDFSYLAKLIASERIVDDAQYSRVKKYIKTIDKEDTEILFLRLLAWEKRYEENHHCGLST